MEDSGCAVVGTIKRIHSCWAKHIVEIDVTQLCVCVKFREHSYDAVMVSSMWYVTSLTREQTCFQKMQHSHFQPSLTHKSSQFLGVQMVAQLFRAMASIRGLP